MKKIYTNSKNNIRIIPLLFVYIYFFLVLADIGTTYLASPDLKYEQNIIIKTFKLGWIEIITLASLSIFIIIFFVIKSNDFLIKFFIKKKKVRKKRFILGIIIHIIFFTHFLETLFVVPNNLLMYFYLNGTKLKLLEKVVSYYIHFNRLFDYASFHIVLILVFILLSVFVFVLRIKYIKKRMHLK